VALFLLLSYARPPAKSQVLPILFGDQQITNLPFGTMITSNH
jgi:hypothetical protein